MGFFKEIFKPNKRLQRGVDSLKIEEDPYLKKLSERTKGIASEQRKQADEYKKQAPELQTKRFNVAGDGLRKELAGNIQGVRQGANKRGLLYSGLRQGAEGQLNSGLSGDLMGAQGAISKDIAEETKRMDFDALQGELQAAQVDQQLKNDLYKRQLQARESYIGRMSPLTGAIRGSLFA